MKPKVVVIGCGLVGALIAYELSSCIEADIYVIDKQLPAQGSTGAALGVLMGIISHKVKGRTWRLREASVRRYRTLITELATQGFVVPFNQQGIVSLCFDEGKLPRWETLKAKRQQQGWPLEIWSPEAVRSRCPHIALTSTDETGIPRLVKAAIYSPADGQVHPAQLTHALIAAAKQRGVTFILNAEVTQLKTQGLNCVAVQTSSKQGQETLVADHVVISAGLGSAALTQFASEPLSLMPVLGQAMKIQLPTVQGDAAFQPVINGDDIQFVPLGEGRYWLGATVEFPQENSLLTAEKEGLKNLQKGAARFCPAIANAQVLSTWSGLRPRPVGQPAPVIKPLGNLENVTLATGHYRNGVLLAPATAQQVCETLQSTL
ncbi:MAG: FAD-dependent oxidoreductase [Cyanobacteria bacterium J06607_10]